MTLKTSVFAAMPSASTTAATAVTAGAARLDRIANRISVQTAVSSGAASVSFGRATNHSFLPAGAEYRRLHARSTSVTSAQRTYWVFRRTELSDATPAVPSDNCLHSVQP